jgi:predicted O-methyltransferase YrrM
LNTCLPNGGARSMNLPSVHEMMTFGQSLSLPRAIYRRAAAPLGRYKLQRMIEGGLPRPFKRPIEFLFTKRLDHDGRLAARRVEAIRAALAGERRLFEVANPDGDDPRRTAAQIAHRSSVTREWGTFLYLCAESFKPRTILELGSCAGISGCYLAASNCFTKFITVEGSPSLARLAESNIGQISDRVEVVNSSFDDALRRILPTLAAGIDLAYLDGHHEYEATLRYFRRLRPRLNTGALLIFDDVHWSGGMWRAWQVLRAHEGFASTIDLGRFGVCLWEGARAVPVHYDLSPYLGWLRRVSS